LETSSTAGRGRTLEGQNPRRAPGTGEPKQRAGGNGLPRGVKPWRRLLPRVVLLRKGGASRGTTGGQGPSRGGPYPWKGKALKGEPKGVNGMKQGREAWGRESRQEVEKAWRRNVVGEVNPREVNFPC
jgi:hypothetical protein